MGAALPLGDPAPADGMLPDDLVLGGAAAFGAYLHVPFCRVRCGYCDFNTYTAGELRGARQDAYADTLLDEVRLAGRVLAHRGPLREASTVFFGGGTPTLLPAGDLARMLEGIRDTFGIANGAEVTVEANPDTVTSAVVDELADAGMMRASFSGGEALLRDDLGTLVRHARERGCVTSLNTNGWLHQRFLEEVAPWLDVLMVSIDGPEPAHDLVGGAERDVLGD